MFLVKNICSIQLSWQDIIRSHICLETTDVVPHLDYEMMHKMWHLNVFSWKDQQQKPDYWQYDRGDDVGAPESHAGSWSCALGQLEGLGALNCQYRQCRPRRLMLGGR